MPRKLHIGGQVKAQGWEVFNAVPGPAVDHMGDARDLSRFEDNIFEEIYASHVLEHFDYINALDAVLKEWFRVLIPGGRLYVSVPDLDILTELFTSKDKLTMNERFFVMRMMFGGHIDQYDYHLVGLNQEFLVYYLVQAGFINLRKVGGFGLFSDTSNMIYKDVRISLNIIAEKPQIPITGI
jgi:predicted SAM-dependent methyltransferase